MKTKVTEAQDKHQKAIKILQRTSDGNFLSGFERWIIKQTLENQLSERGLKSFQEIYVKYAG